MTICVPYIGQRIPEDTTYIHEWFAGFHFCLSTNRFGFGIYKRKMCHIESGWARHIPQRRRCQSFLLSTRSKSYSCLSGNITAQSGWHIKFRCLMVHKFVFGFFFHCGSCDARFQSSVQVLSLHVPSKWTFFLSKSFCLRCKFVLVFFFFPFPAGEHSSECFYFYCFRSAVEWPYLMASYIYGWVVGAGRWLNRERVSAQCILECQFSDGWLQSLIVPSHIWMIWTLEQSSQMACG